MSICELPRTAALLSGEIVQFYQYHWPRTVHDPITDSITCADVAGPIIFGITLQQAHL